MKALYTFILAAALIAASSCGNKKTGTDLMDSIKNANIDEKWTPIVPDTAGMRKKYTVVEITTNLGVMEVALFDATPKHRDNFLKLVESGFYNDLLFHRIQKDFMIQGGDPKSKNAPMTQDLGSGGPGYELDAEIKDTLYHYKGALCAARLGDDINPEKKSSGSQFYIVSGALFGTTALKNAIKDRAMISFLTNPDNLSYKLRLANYQKTGNEAAMQVLMGELTQQVQPLTDSLYNSFPARARQMYATWGGYPALDKEYTIFGFLIKGYDVLDAAQKVKTNPNQRPLEEVKIIKARVLKKP